jgi:hypothetical protein
VYRRDRRGRFAPTPGAKVTSALQAAEKAVGDLDVAITEALPAIRAKAKKTRRTVRRHAVAGAVVGAAVPAPAAVKVTATGATAFATATTAAGYKIGQKVGRSKVNRRAAAGRKVRK